MKNKKRFFIILGIVLLLVLGITAATTVKVRPASYMADSAACTTIWTDTDKGFYIQICYTTPEGPTPAPTETDTSVPSVTASATNTFASTSTFTLTPSKTLTRTPSLTQTFTKTYTPFPITPSTPVPLKLKYYLVDGVINNADFAKLAGWGINTAIVYFDVSQSTATWQARFQAAKNAGINVVIWPTAWNSKRANCSWGAPYPVSTNGDITKVKPLIDVASQYSNFIGIVNASEAYWTACPMTNTEMAGLKTQLTDYAFSKGKTIKVWNYINSLYADRLPTDMINKVMDVAVTWKHCAGNAEAPCEGSNSAMSQVLSDASRLKNAGLTNTIDLVYIVQTFTTDSPYNVKFDLGYLEALSCAFIGNNVLEGYGYYTWDAGWWPDLSEWADLQPAIPWVYQTCVGSIQPTSTPGVPTIVPTSSNTPVVTSTFTRTFTPSNTLSGPTNTPSLTRTPTLTFTPSNTPTKTNTPVPGAGFTFASIGDGQGISSTFLKTTNQIASVNPNLVIFNGDLENDGVVSSEMNTMVGNLKTSGIFDRTFLTRGNHDNHISGSAAAWNSYFSTAPNIKVPPAGVTNYTAMNTSSTYLTYSFDYGNARFIGMDVPGDVGLLTSAQYTFIDQRLTDAESNGLTHAFIFFHGGEYCTTSIHCSCSSKSDGSCTPSAFVSMINKHPIVSATFHGHEHILAWIHMDNARVSSLTRSYESFFTSPSGGGSYNSYIYSNRVDYYYTPMASYNENGFFTVNVNGTSFTVSIYKTGNTTPVWSKTFSK